MRVSNLREMAEEDEREDNRALHERLLETIRVVAASNRTFEEKAHRIGDFTAELDRRPLAHLLGTSGFIPEEYAHDSSEEKLYAKAMDFLVAAALRKVGYEAEATPERSDAADVTAIHPNHGVVLDAKAFRLSRTALNPKDYKIEALSGWRQGHDYAALVGPLAGFPDRKSRLFVEAVRFNVTLLTYSHLQFMLLETEDEDLDLGRVWTTGTRVNDPRKVGDATAYWATLDTEFCSALGTPMDNWIAARKRFFEDMMTSIDREIERLETRITGVRSADRESLIETALAALGFQGKLAVIRRKKDRTRQLLDNLEATETDE